MTFFDMLSVFYIILLPNKLADHVHFMVFSGIKIFPLINYIKMCFHTIHLIYFSNQGCCHQGNLYIHTVFDLYILMYSLQILCIICPPNVSEDSSFVGIFCLRYWIIGHNIHICTKYICKTHMKIYVFRYNQTNKVHYDWNIEIKSW